MTKIMVVDDHTIIRQGIAGLLNSVEGFEVVAEAGTGSAAVRFAVDLRPDIIIMDMSLPDMDGIETARQIIAKGVESGIIFLTMHNDSGLCETAMRAGGRGYLLKDNAMDDLLYAIKAVLRGELFTSVPLTNSSILPLAKRADGTSRIGGKGTTPLCTSLTKRETEIVALIAEGMSSKEIADKLFISIKTVETHRGHIMEKLGVRSVADITKYAIRSGLVR